MTKNIQRRGEWADFWTGRYKRTHFNPDKKPNFVLCRAKADGFCMGFHHTQWSEKVTCRTCKTLMRKGRRAKPYNKELAAHTTQDTAAMNKIWKSFIKLIENLLNDDNGISEESYNHILDMIEENFGNIHPDDFNIWMSIYRQVKATDGRFYLKD